MRQRLGFSVVINTLNRAEYLRTALEALRYQRHPKFEVIVVNGPSTDDTEAVMKQYTPMIRAGSVGEANLSKSRNVGIALSRGEIVCFMDDDAVPEPDWLERLENAYLADQGFGAVGGFIRDHSGVDFQSRYLVCDGLGDAQDYATREEAQAAVEASDGWKYFSQTGCNSSFRREVLLEIGGFDEEFAYFLDETDVNLRIDRAGWKVGIEAAAEVHHKYAPSHLRDHKRVPKRLYFPLRSKAYFALRHARSHRPVAKILDYLSRHAREIHRYNKWYVDRGEIDVEHYNRLTRDVDEGLRDGIRDAMGTKAPRLMGEAELARHADGAFKPFPALLEPRERLRICYLSQEYPPNNCGGIGVWTALMARSMAARGHEVSVIARATSDRNTVDFEDGVWIHRIVPQWQPGRTEPNIGDLPQSIKDYAWSAYDEAVRIHLRRGLDLVSAPIWDLEGAACLKAGVIPTIISLHTTYELALPFKPDWAEGTEHRTRHVDKVIAGERAMLAGARHVMANSQAILSDLEAVTGVEGLRARAAVIPHGMEDAANRFAPAPKDGWIRVLFVGRLELRKGADIMLEILPGLMAGHERLKVEFVGDDSIAFETGTLREKFERQFGDEPWFHRVTFRGFVASEVLHAAYRDCDIFVAPSQYESFGLVFLEAMRAGKPSIGTMVGGIKEVIDHGETGLLVQPGDSAELKAAVQRLIDDINLRNELGQAARAKFEARFVQSRIAQLAESYYRQCIREVGDQT